jgi:hypothetical protein
LRSEDLLICFAEELHEVVRASAADEQDTRAICWRVAGGCGTGSENCGLKSASVAALFAGAGAGAAALPPPGIGAFGSASSAVIATVVGATRGVRAFEGDPVD